VTKTYFTLKKGHFSHTQANYKVNTRLAERSYYNIFDRALFKTCLISGVSNECRVLVTINFLRKGDNLKQFRVNNVARRIHHDRTASI
jgi:hypothetical protein